MRFVVFGLFVGGGLVNVVVTGLGDSGLGVHIRISVGSVAIGGIAVDDVVEGVGVAIDSGVAAVAADGRGGVIRRSIGLGIRLRGGIGRCIGFGGGIGGGGGRCGRRGVVKRRTLIPDEPLRDARDAVHARDELLE